VEQECAGPPAVPPELGDRLGWLLARAGHQVGMQLVAALADVGVNPRELSVLAAAAPQPRPQLGLAIAVGLDKTTMVATVDALERRGLVRRESHPDDRRIRLVTVTAEGRRVAARGTRIAAEVEERVLSALPARERERLVPLLRSLVAAAPGGPPSGSCV
jgi:MarR family transcriptional regulator, transcriptional regulator for hemolysin